VCAPKEDLMNKFIRFVAGIVIPASLLAGGISSSAMAADATVKVLLENDKVRVTEATYKPGDVNTAINATKPRVFRILKGGTIERTYADGKQEKIVFKTGEVKYVEPGPGYTAKNVGKTTYMVYTVQVK
jgi:mannose-6-phosphate isomerase-like protein (cupin superfamily)